MPLRYPDALVETFSDLLFLPVCLPLHLAFFCSHSVFQSFFHVSLFLPSLCLSICHPLSNCMCSHFVSLLLHFHPMGPFSLLQSNPFTLSSNSLGHPRIHFFHLSPSNCLLVSSSLSLPLCSAHLQHIKIPLFFLQRIVQSLRDLLHSSMLFLLLTLHICLPLFLSILAALHSV